MKMSYAELKKLLTFREVYIALLLCLGILLLYFYSSDLPNPNFDFWLSIYNFMPYMGFLCVAVMIVVGISRLFPYEREVGVDELLKTYKHGRVKLLLAKVLAICSYCFLIVTLFYMIAFGVYGTIYAIEGFHLPMESSYTSYHNFNNPDIGSFTRVQYLLYVYCYMILASISFGLFILIISLIIRKSVWIIAICGGYFIALEFYNKFLFKINIGEVFDRVFHIPLSILYTYSFNGIMSFDYILRVRLTEYWMIIMSICIPIIIQIGLLIFIDRRKQRC